MTKTGNLRESFGQPSFCNVLYKMSGLPSAFLRKVNYLLQIDEAFVKLGTMMAANYQGRLGEIHSYGQGSTSPHRGDRPDLVYVVAVSAVAAQHLSG